MSAGYVAVGWNRSKLVYDAVLMAAVVLYLTLYQRGHLPVDDPTRAMKAYGSCAFFMLSLVLAIGPLARLDHRFLPLLYNRRHFGVMTCAVAAGHVDAVLGWYFSVGTAPPLEAMLGADTSFGQLHGFPFIPFGIGAFVILLALALTSHDFWLAFLTPPVWKSLHRLIYLAYALVAAHLALGVFQDARNPVFPILALVTVIAVGGLHTAAARLSWQEDRETLWTGSDGWIAAGDPAAIADGRAITVPLDDGEAVAIFRDGDMLAAVGNACAHQNGPLGEGRVIDGCVTCPWHGYQYRLTDGRAPPPFTEKLPTYRLRLIDGRLMLDPRANPPGTPTEPVRAPLPVAP